MKIALSRSIASGNERTGEKQRENTHESTINDEKIRASEFRA